MASLSDDQLKAEKLILNGHNVVVMGQAGTGKSFLVKSVASSLRSIGKTVSITASTGIAPQHFLDGTIIHSWAGMLDGRFTNNELIDRLQMPEQEATAKRVQHADVLIIDEISLISQKVFEQLEFVCHKLRSTGEIYFGGIQVVCVGDFYQLPPVPNDLYQEAGVHIIHCDIWKNAMPHKVYLYTVIRQSEVTLINAINELERGQPSPETRACMCRLQRQLLSNMSNEESVHLYTTHFEVDCHNVDMLNNMPGETVSYIATDSGDNMLLRQYSAKRILQLKMNCPVVLLRNISSKLANGLRGVVIKMDENGPTVKFENIIVKLEMYSFSVYDPAKRKVLAERHQFPIALSFALTVHKAQGSTMPRLVLHCQNMYQAGQIGTALGRSVCIDGLQVLGYLPSSCRGPKKDVVDFCNEAGLEPQQDNSCCQTVYIANISDSTAAVETLSDGSSFDASELRAIDDFEKTLQSGQDNQALVRENYSLKEIATKRAQTVTGTCKWLKPGTVPNVFKFDIPLTPSANRRQERAQRKRDLVPDEMAACLDVGNEVVVHTTEEGESTSYTNDTRTSCVAVQCDLLSERSCLYSIERFQESPDTIKFYTGFDNYDHFMLFYQILGPAVNELPVQTDR